MAANDLKIRITADSQQANRELTRLQTSLESMRKGAATLAKGLGAIGAGSIAAFGYAAKQIADNAAALGRLSQSSGLSVKALSELQYAAKASGLDVDLLSDSLMELNLAATEAAGGAKGPAEAFAALGVKVTEANGQIRNGEAILTDLADAFSRFRDGPEKAAVAVRLFGEEGVRLIPFLNQGREGIGALRAEAERLGVSLTTEGAAAAQEFSRNMETLKAAATGVAQQITMGALPAINDLTEALKDPETQRALQDLGKATVTVMNGIISATAETAKAMRWLGEEIAAVTAGIASDDIPRLEAELQNLQAALDNPTLRLRFFGPGGVVEYWSEEELKAEMVKIHQAIQAARQTMPALAPITAPRVNMPDLPVIALPAESAASRGAGAGARGMTDALREQRAELANMERDWEAVEKQVKDLEAALVQLVEVDGVLEGPAIDALQESLADGYALSGQLQAKLEELRASLNLPAEDSFIADFGEQARKAIEDAAEASAKAQEAMRSAKEAGQDMGNAIALAFEDAILQARNLQDVLKALLQDLARIILRKGVTENLGNAIGDFLGDVLKNIKFANGGIMSSQGAMALPRFALGGVMTGSGPLPLRRYAAGGIATTPQLALFGEGRTPEAYVPLPDGRSIPVSFKEQVAAAPAVTLDVTVNNLPGQSATVQQDSQGGLTIEIVRAQLANDMTRGGVPWVTSLERRYGMTRGRG